MTTTSDGSPPGGGSEFPDTAPLAVTMPPAPGELPPPPPLLSHLQPEAQHPAAPDDEQPPAGRAARRLPADTPSGAGRVLLPIALCLVGVVALGAGWTHLEADRAAEAQTPVAVGPAAKPPVPSLGASSPGATPAAGTSPSASPSPSASRSASPSSSASRSAATQPSASASGTGAAPTTAPSASPTPPPVIDRSVPVVVLNATNRTGLAAEVAKRLRAKGWTVVSVGNWTRGVPTTTVYATGRAAAAATMRYDAKPADATRPTRDGMPKNRIVLVIGPDFPILAGR